MNLSDFNTIAINTQTPGVYVEFSSVKATSGALPPLPLQALVLGQRTTAGSVAQLVVKKITAKGQGAVYFGKSSQLAAMCDAFIAANPNCPLDAIALSDNGAGTAAGGNVSITGPATANGTLALYIGGIAVDVAVTAGDTAAEIATNIVAAIAANAYLPVTAAVDGTHNYQVNCTAVHKGLCGNTIDIRTNYYLDDVMPLGVGATITAMAGGATDPDISAAIAAIGDKTYSSIVMPYTGTANVTAMTNLLLTRWGGMYSNDGLVFNVLSGSWDTIDTAGLALNSGFLFSIGSQNTPTLPWVQAAITAGIESSEGDPARPRQHMNLPYLLPPATTDQYERSERNQHILDGISTFYVDDGGMCHIERLVSTYKTNEAGAPDTSYRKIESLRTLSAFRYSSRQRIGTKWPRMKLGQDGSVGPNVLTPKAARAEMIALYMDWVNAGWAEGGDAITQFKNDLIVQIDPDNGDQLLIMLPPNLINQLIVTAAQIQFQQ